MPVAKETKYTEQDASFCFGQLSDLGFAADVVVLELCHDGIFRVARSLYSQFVFALREA